MDLSPRARFGFPTFLTLLALAAPAAPAAPAAAEDIVKTKASYRSGDKDIHVERYDPPGKGPFPALLLLHGSNGPEAHGKDYRAYAELLAEKGYVAILVNYFDRTGTEEADLKTIKDNYLVWMATLSDGIAYAGALPNVDRKHIGLLGFSLGSYLSLSVAALRGRDHVAVVAEYVGALPDSPIYNLKKMPPVLILHGEKDDIVPVKEARDLDALLTKYEVPHEIKIYEDQKHVFKGDDAKDATERVLRFFDKYLKKPVEGAK